MASRTKKKLKSEVVATGAPEVHQVVTIAKPRIYLGEYWGHRFYGVEQLHTQKDSGTIHVTAIVYGMPQLDSPWLTPDMRRVTRGQEFVGFGCCIAEAAWKVIGQLRSLQEAD
jgi:hypothetical protein